MKRHEEGGEGVLTECKWWAARWNMRRCMLVGGLKAPQLTSTRGWPLLPSPRLPLYLPPKPRHILLTIMQKHRTTSSYLFMTA